MSTAFWTPREKHSLAKLNATQILRLLLQIVLLHLLLQTINEEKSPRGYLLWGTNLLLGVGLAFEILC